MPSQQLNQDAIAFIGGGNMASAIIGGLLRQGLAPGQIQVVEPLAARWAVQLQVQRALRPAAQRPMASLPQRLLSLRLAA